MAYRPSLLGTRAGMDYERLLERDRELRRLEERRKQLEETATDLRAVFAGKEGSGEHRILELFISQIGELRDDMMGMFKAYDAENRELSARVAKVEIWNKVLLVGTGTLLAALAKELIASLFHRS